MIESFEAWIRDDCSAPREPQIKDGWNPAIEEALK